MATAKNEKMIILQERFADFARETIAPRTDLHTMEGFPDDIWKRMAGEKLLGLGISEKYGGLGGNYLSISMAGETIVRHGHNLGFALSWFIHQVISRYLIEGFGNEKQCEIYLSDLASGKITISVAVSEPEARAHPKYLKTSGQHRDGFYVLNGVKSYLTNGSIANLFIVFAVTGVDAGRKQFTAFMVPKETEGLSITRELKFNFLRPSPHCEIKIENCSVPVSNILGGEGSAYGKMAKPFREIEEVCLMGPIVGGMERQLLILIDLIKEQNVKPSDDLKKDIGELRSIIDTLRIMACEAANMLDSGIYHPEFLSLLLYFRNLSGHFQSFLKDTMSGAGIEENSDLAVITNDLIHTIDIARYVAVIKQKKLGEKLLRKG